MRHGRPRPISSPTFASRAGQAEEQAAAPATLRRLFEFYAEVCRLAGRVTRA